MSDGDICVIAVCKYGFNLLFSIADLLEAAREIKTAYMVGDERKNKEMMSVFSQSGQSWRATVRVLGKENWLKSDFCCPLSSTCAQKSVDMLPDILFSD